MQLKVSETRIASQAELTCINSFKLALLAYTIVLVLQLPDLQVVYDQLLSAALH